jgi:WD40 repeat protein
MRYAVFAPDTKTLAACGSDGRVIWWDVATGKKRAEQRHPGPVAQVAFADNGKLLATANANGTISIYQFRPR